MLIGSLFSLVLHSSAKIFRNLEGKCHGMSDHRLIVFVPKSSWTKWAKKKLHKTLLTMKKNCTPAFSLYFCPFIYWGVVNKYIHALSISLSFSLSIYLYISFFLSRARERYVCVCECIFWHLKGEGPENWTGVKGGKIHCEAYTQIHIHTLTMPGEMRCK